MNPSRPLADPRRGISPTVGVVLLVVIVVALSGLTAAMVFGLSDEPAVPPQTTFEFDYNGGTYAVTIQVTQGDEITAENTDRLVVAVDSGSETGRRTWAGRSTGVVHLESDDVGVGNEVVVDDARGVEAGDLTLPFKLREDDEVSLVWIGPDDGQSTVLETDVVSWPAGGSGSFGILDGDGSVVVVPTGAVAGVGGGTADLFVGGAQVLGSTADVDGDGRIELPYVDGSGNLKLNDSEAEVRTLVDRSAVAGTAKPDTDKSLMATGTWQGSPLSVFYVDHEHEEIYRVEPGGSPTLVRDVSSNGANSVLGIGDIDGDGNDELVYADGSQTVRYLEPGGSVKTTGFTSGSNNGIGSGPLADVDGDGTDEAVVVDGSNDIRLVEGSGATAKPAQSSVDAAKSPVTAADVDDDGARELVYVDASSTNLKYVDDLAGSPTVETLKDADGNVVPGDKPTGVVS